MSVIGYDEIKELAEASNETGLSPQQELAQIGVDEEGLHKIAEEMVSHVAFLIQAGDPIPAVLAGLFVSGFGLGAAAAQRIAEVSA